MAETQSRPRLVRFGAFAVDVQTGELRKDGVKLKFSGQPFQVLAILLERPGEVVTREELQRRLWPDTFVDVERNLNTAVNKIREVLGDSAESPRYVETLPRRGYRFIGTLEPPVQPQAPVEPIRAQKPRRKWVKIAAGVLGIMVLVFGAIVAYRWHRQQRQQEQETLSAVPFTALAGQETAPAFSPDGSRIAFAWNADPGNGGKGFDLYVKAIGSETLLRLTRHPSEWISPAWSPDGTHIAFHRLAGADTGIYVVPALGGPERKLRSTRLPGGWGPISMISWSPDGKWIAFTDVPGDEHAMMSLLSTETLETAPLPKDESCLEQGQPAFSHSGDILAYWCSRTEGWFEAGLYFLTLPDGKPKMIGTFRAFPNGLTWSADDKKLIYTLWKTSSFQLGEIIVANGSVKWLTLEGSAQLPTVSPKGEKLAYSSVSKSSNIWRKDLLNQDAHAVELIPSSRAQFDAQYSPDGKRIAFTSARSGLPGVWISNDDGTNLVQISNSNYMSGSPQWSPDGNRIAFDSLPHDRWEIYVAGVAERKPRKLITNISSVTRPHWSRDGQWIYFRSDQPGRMGIYRCPASGGDAVALSTDIHGFNPQESFDGKTVYFFAGREDKSTLKKVALPPRRGTEAEVDGLPPLNDAGLWALSPGGIYFVPYEAPRSLRYFDFTTRKVRPIFEMDTDFGSGLSVSHDGHSILYSQEVVVNSDIMLVDHFH